VKWDRWVRTGLWWKADNVCPTVCLLYIRPILTRIWKDGKMERCFALTKVIPDIHLATQSSNFYDLLTEKVIRLAGELWTKSGFEVVVFVPEIRDSLHTLCPVTSLRRSFDILCLNTVCPLVSDRSTWPHLTWRLYLFFVLMASFYLTKWFKYSLPRDDVISFSWRHIRGGNSI